MSRASLDAATFATLAERFAAESSARSPSWTYVNAAAQGSASPFSMSPKGYLKASPLLLPPTADAMMAALDSSLGEETDEQEEETITNLLPPRRLELHIVYSETYQVPVLLLQGYHSDGALWTPDELRTHLIGVMKGGGQAGVRPEVAESTGEPDEDAALQGAGPELSGVGFLPLAATQVSQIEHPVLRMPFCCVDPCGTSDLMGSLLSSGGHVSAGAMDTTEREGKLDYLSAWWSVLAPLVGAETRSQWYAHVVQREV